MALCGRNKYVLEFEVKGGGFPSGTDQWLNNIKFSFKSNTEQNMYIDYNDGSVVEKYHINENSNISLYAYNNTNDVDFYDNNDLSNLPTTGDIKYKGKSFIDSSENLRIIKIRFDTPLNIISFNGAFVYDCYSISENILNYNSINGVSLLYMINLEKLPKDLISLRNINSLQLANCFNNSTIEYMSDYIPLGFFNLQLKSFNISGIELGDAIRNGKNTNIQHIGVLKNTLTSLEMEACRLDEENITSDILNSFSELYKIKSLYVGFNYFETTPIFINTLSSLTFLRIGGGFFYDNKLKYWGDLSNLVNLQKLHCPIARTIELIMPPYIKDMPLLTEFNIQGSYKTQERFDPFVYDMYEYITINAPIDNDDVNNKVSCRAFNVLMDRYDDEYIVQGEYQQPDGYVQGVSNGTPTSQLEKIWVLEHQYNVTVTYTDNRP